MERERDLLQIPQALRVGSHMADIRRPFFYLVVVRVDWFKLFLEFLDF